MVCGGLDTADDLAEMQARIEQAVGRPLLLGGGTELVTASVGVSVGRDLAEEPEAAHPPGGRGHVRGEARPPAVRLRIRG